MSAETHNSRAPARARRRRLRWVIAALVVALAVAWVGWMWQRGSGPDHAAALEKLGARVFRRPSGPDWLWDWLGPVLPIERPSYVVSIRADVLPVPEGGWLHDRSRVRPEHLACLPAFPGLEEPGQICREGHAARQG